MYFNRCSSFKHLLFVKRVLLLQPGVRLFLNPCLKELRVQVKFDRIISRCNCLEIPFNIVVLLDLLHVVNDVNDRETEEDD